MDTKDYFRSEYLKRKQNGWKQFYAFLPDKKCYDELMLAKALILKKFKEENHEG